MKKIKFYLTGDGSQYVEELVTQEHLAFLFSEVLSKGRVKANIPEELSFLKGFNLLIKLTDQFLVFRFKKKIITLELYSLISCGISKSINNILHSLLRSDNYGKLSSNYDLEDTIWLNDILIEHSDNYYSTRLKDKLDIISESLFIKTQDSKFNLCFIEEEEVK